MFKNKKTTIKIQLQKVELFSSLVDVIGVKDKMELLQSSLAVAWMTMPTGLHPGVTNVGPLRG